MLLTGTSMSGAAIIKDTQWLNRELINHCIMVFMQFYNDFHLISVLNSDIVYLQIKQRG